MAGKRSYKEVNAGVELIAVQPTAEDDGQSHSTDCHENTNQHRFSAVRQQRAARSSVDEASSTASTLVTLYRLSRGMHQSAIWVQIMN